MGVSGISASKRILQNVLLIDDDQIYGNIFQFSLKLINPSADLRYLASCDSGIDYLIGLKRNELAFPDLIMVDVNMPMKDGYSFIKMYQNYFGEDNRSTVIYMSTSSMIASDYAKSKDYQIIKGFKVKDDVTDTIQEIIDESFS